MKKKNTQWKKNNWDIKCAELGVVVAKELGIHLEGVEESWYLPNGQKGVTKLKTETLIRMQSYLVVTEDFDRKEAEDMVPDNANNFDRIFPKESQRNEKQARINSKRLWSIVHAIVKPAP